MRVLIGCEYSATVREAFARRGHDAWSCDILPTDVPGNHYQGDIFDILYDGKWDLFIHHSPCTYLTNAGVCHLHTEQGRWQKMQDGANFFKRLQSAKVDKVCGENPIMHKYAVEIIGSKGTQIIQPWMFGHLETKATVLHLRGLPKLIPTTNLKAQTYALPARIRQRLHYLPPSPERAKLRSKTYEGIAEAMADQWGNIMQKELFA